MILLFKIALLAASASFFIAVTSVALAGFLIFSGDQQPCVDRTTQPATVANGTALQADWFEAAQAVAAGETATVGVNEEQATSLATEYLEAKGVPVSDLRVYFCPDGTAQVAGRLGILGLDSNVVVEGHIDTGEAEPRIVVDSVKAGNFPNFLGKRLVSALLNDNDARSIPLGSTIGDIEYGDGVAQVTITP